MRNDQGLVEAVQRGDRQAFSELAHKYRAPLLALAYQYTGRLEDAQDLVQDSLLAAYRDLASLRDARKFRGWLYAILRHHGLRYREQHWLQDEPLEHHEETLIADHALDNSELFELLNGLPAADREVLVAYYIYGLSHREIAEAHGIAENTVAVRCSRARERLRRAVRDAEEETQRLLQRALGVILAFPFSDDFLHRVLKEEGPVTTTSTLPAPPVHHLPGVAGWKIAITLAVLGTLVLGGIALRSTGLPPGGNALTGLVGTVFGKGKTDKRLNARAYALDAEWTAPAGNTTAFNTPYGLAIDAQGNLYVVDSGNVRLCVLSPQGKLIREWSLVTHPAEKESECPRYVTLDARGNVYVLTAGEFTSIRQYAPTGELLNAWSSWGTGQGQLNDAYGLCADGKGHIFVADTHSERIQVFSEDGKYLNAWSTTDTGKHTFSPVNLTIDERGNLLVAGSVLWADAKVTGGKITSWVSYNGNPEYSVKYYSPKGELLARWGKYGREPGQFIYASAIAVDVAGNRYITDAHQPRIQKFSPDGELMACWGTAGSGPSPSQLGTPVDIAVAKDGTVYVNDAGNNRIQVYKPAP